MPFHIYAYVQFKFGQFKHVWSPPTLSHICLSSFVSLMDFPSTMNDYILWMVKRLTRFSFSQLIGRLWTKYLVYLQPTNYDATFSFSKPPQTGDEMPLILPNFHVFWELFLWNLHQACSCVNQQTLLCFFSFLSFFFFFCGEWLRNLHFVSRQSWICKTKTKWERENQAANRKFNN